MSKLRNSSPIVYDDKLTLNQKLYELDNMFTNTVIKFPHSIFVRTLGKVLEKQVHKYKIK